MSTTRGLASAWILSVLAAGAGAVPVGQQGTPIGAASVNPCAGLAVSGFNPQPGGVYGVGSADRNCAEQTSAVNGTAGATAVKSGVANGDLYSATSTASAQPGLIKLQAGNSGSFNTPFSGGAATAGWNDGITLLNGTGQGIWVFPIHVNGSLSANGLGAYSMASVAIYQNHAAVTANGATAAAFNLFHTLSDPIANGTVAFGWDYEQVVFETSDYGPGHPQTLNHMTIDRTIFFAVPFTYGEEFTLGVWALDVAGETASGGPAVANQATVDLAQTIQWAGPGYVLLPNGSRGLQVEIRSASAFDYDGSASAVPEPASLWLLTLGVVTLWRPRARHGRTHRA